MTFISCSGLQNSLLFLKYVIFAVIMVIARSFQTVQLKRESGERPELNPQL